MLYETQTFLEQVERTSNISNENSLCLSLGTPTSNESSIYLQIDLPIQFLLNLRDHLMAEESTDDSDPTKTVEQG